MASGSILPKKTVSGAISNVGPGVHGSMSGGGGGSGGTSDHTKLRNRDLPDQHPIEAISDLPEILSQKLDSKTALPLIEEALKTKAKGLYYDVNKELANKAYWYLTSEIDPVSKIGTKASIISGPYDLGQGGGGGGGVTEVKLSIAIDPETGKQIWPANIAVGSKCEIGVDWSSTRDGEPTGKGTLYVYVNNKLVITKSSAQGIVIFDISDSIVSGMNKIEIKVVDIYSTTKNLIDSINGVTLQLSSNFEDDLSYKGDIVFPYIPVGSIRKYVHFIVDDVEAGDPEVVDTTGEQWTRLIPKALLPHGSHTLRVYFTVTLDDQEVRSNELYYDLICYEDGVKTPIIASTFAGQSEQEQYVSFNIKYRVFTPDRNTSDVYLRVDDTVLPILTVDTKYQNWTNRFDTVGNHMLIIETGHAPDTAQKIFNVRVTESKIHVEPVSQNVALALSSFGRYNTEPEDERAKWEDSERGITSTLTGFNWSSNGWVTDDTNNSVLRVSGDARVTINYKPFEVDFTQSGKTLEFEIATRDIKDYESRLIECLDGSDSISFSHFYAGEDTRTKKFQVSEIDIDKFAAKVTQVHQTYTFQYDGENWDLDGIIVTQDQMLSDYGISIIKIDLDPTVIEPSHFLAGDKIVVYYTVSGRGFYVTPQLAKLQSQQSSLSTQYKEDDKVRLSFVVEKRTEGSSTFKTRLIYMFINGIMSGVSRYAEADTFQQTPAKFITIGSNNATIDIYNIRIYDNNLTRRQVLNNWIADTVDPVLKAERYYHNDNYDDNGKINLDKIAALGNLPYMILNSDTLPAYKKDRKLIDIDYINPGDDDRNFTAPQARVDVQGTSSQYYYKKNFKIKFEQGFYDKNGNWSEHYKLRGDDSKKEKTFTFKADVASSEGANNVELVRYFEDTKNWFSPPELIPDEDIPGSVDSKKRIRVGIDGFPIVMFQNDGSETKFYGKMNFNNDKGNERTFGFKDGDECWEFVNNSTPQVLFKSADLSNWSESFEGRFPEENDAGEPYGTNPSERTRLQALLNWVVSTRRLDTDPDSEKQRKLNKFKSEFNQYFDKDSAIFYYLYTELFLLVDSRAKNAMLCYYKSRQEGDGGDKWFWIPYDMDTALGINNEGLLVFNYDKEDIDTQDGSYVFNGQDSVFWTNLRDAFEPELASIYHTLRTSTQDRTNWSFDGVDKYFSDHQSVWTEALFNEDAYSKYLEPYVLNQDATYLGMAQGSKLEQRRWWLYNRFKYLDSKYNAADVKNDTLMIRAYVPAQTIKPGFTVVPYANIYVAANYRNGQEIVPIRAKKGVPTYLPNPVEYEASETDQETILYSASQLMDIGDISPFKPGYADFSKATKLTRLQIGSTSTGYENPNLRGINVGANHLLTYLDARNCTNLGTEGKDATPTIDLSQCTSIEEVYFDNTQILGCSFPIGGNLKVVHLPRTLTSLTIRNHPNLEEFVIAGTSGLTSIWLENIPGTVISAYNYVMTMPEGSRIRLIGIDEPIENVDILKAFYDKLDLMHGTNGSGDFVEKAQITGKIRLSTISYKDYIELTSRYPEVEIIAGTILCTVEFYNDEVLFGNPQVVIKGRSAVDPGVPQRAPTEQYYYTFKQWDKSFINVQTDLQINAIYDAHIQNYRISFNTQSAAIATPDHIDKDYGEKINISEQPELTEIPEQVEFLGWYHADGLPFEFESEESEGEIIHMNETLYAHWHDELAPTLLVQRATFNTFNYLATDNVGITAWAVLKENRDPTEEDWIYLTEPQQVFTGAYTIDSYGYYYMYVKDAQEYIIQKVIKAEQLILDIGEGVLNNGIYEGDSLLTDFALSGTVAIIKPELDEHYEGLRIHIDDFERNFGDQFVINKSINIRLTCNRKFYTVFFNTFGKGITPDPQVLQYLSFVDEPDPQFDTDEVLTGWYKDRELTQKWYFREDVVEGDMTLYAWWEAYHDPTIYTIDLIDSDVRTITLNFTQTISEGVEIDWGDETTHSRSANTGWVTLNHTYASGNVYRINIYRRSGEFYPGASSLHKAIEPIEVLSDLQFSWDVPYTEPYAFEGAVKLTSIGLTPYMTKISDSAFRNCSGLLTLTLPDSLTLLGYSAFEGCSNIRNPISFGYKLLTIQDNAFRGCSLIPDFVFTIGGCSVGEYVFSGCASLTALPAGISDYSRCLFQDCTGLTSIELGANVTSLAGQVFVGCANLNKVIISNPNLTFGQGYNFDSCPQLTTAGPIGGDYSIEFAFDKRIPDRAFSGLTSLEDVVIPETVTEIGDETFANCQQITDITLPSELEAIGENAFNRCSRIVELNIPRTAVTIEQNAFSYCTGLLRVYIRPTMTRNRVNQVSQSWFLGCYPFTTLYIPNIFEDIQAIKNAYGDCWNFYDDGYELHFEMIDY